MRTPVKCKLKFAGGWKIYLPKNTNAVSLLMEWLVANRLGVAVVTENSKANSFVISLNAGIHDTYLELLEYLNSNLLIYDSSNC